MRSELALAFATISALACAHQTDAKTRRAFERSSGASNESGGVANNGSDGGPADPDGIEIPAKVGWERLDEVVRESTDILEASPTGDTVARLAQAWCDVEPEPRVTEHGEVRVCYPQPPVNIDGHAFSLELGAIGVIGLVASDLSERDSRSLTDQALTKIRAVCADSFKKTVSEQSTSHEVHTCATNGGSMVAVGRLPVSQGVWQVSIAIVSAT